jgi:hypothetical protein
MIFGSIPLGRAASGSLARGGSGSSGGSPGGSLPKSLLWRSKGDPAKFPQIIQFLSPQTDLCVRANGCGRTGPL